MSEDAHFSPTQPTMQAPRSAKPATGYRSGCLWMLAIGAFALALVSLAINGVLVAALLQRQAFLRAGIDQALVALDHASTTDATFSFPISQTIDFEGDIPLQQDLVFPFEANVPINTTIRVPIDLGPLGTQVINVPVNTTVPIDVDLPVHIDQTFPVQIKVPVRMDVPITLSPTEPPLSDWLGGLRRWLVLLRDQI